MTPEFTPAHGYAEIFDLHVDGIIDLAKRIEDNGLREPCVTLGGLMLDGRRRERACHRAGVKPTYREFGTRKTDGADPLEFIIDLNLHRRHLGEGERVLAAARYATAKGGKPAQNAQVCPTNAEAAAKFNVPESKLRRAKKVVASGTPELQAAVADDTIAVADAAKVADRPAKVQNKAVEDVKAGKAKTASAAAETTIEEFLMEDEDQPDRTPDEVMREKATAIETFCRAVTKFVEDNIPREDEWLTHQDRIISAIHAFKEGCMILRWAKCTDLCPICKGSCCESCQNSGRVPKAVYRMLVK